MGEQAEQIKMLFETLNQQDHIARTLNIVETLSTEVRLVVEHYKKMDASIKIIEIELKKLKGRK